MQQGKKAAFLLLMLLFAVALFGTAHALNYTIAQHTINIQIGTDGKDTATEKFYINFQNDSNKIAFRDKSLQLGTSIDEWAKLNPLFVPSIGINTLNNKIAYTEGEQNYLQISYDLSDTLMAKGKDATMLTEYDIKANYFNSFYQSGLWIIPENTALSIELPPGAEIQGTVEPQAAITSNGTRKVVTYQGYESGNKLAMSYVLWKKIQPVIDLNAITGFLFKTQAGMLLLVAVLIVIVVIVWQRKRLGKRIEEFVETHSLIQEE